MVNDILQTTYLQNRVSDYIIFLSLFIIAVIAIRVLKNVILRRLKVWSEKTSTTIDNFVVRVIENKVFTLLYFGAFYLTLKSLTLTPYIEKILNMAGVVILTVFAIRILILVINYTLESYARKKALDSSKQHNLKGMMTIITILIWAVGITFLLDNLGFEIAAVIAGLGIGGIAVALAAQAILGDLFSYFVIFFDRPFELGDFIIIGEYMGSIEHIGLKTTRIRSLSGEQLVFSNTDLTDSRIRNYKRMEKRRILFKFGVVYQTGLAQLKEIPGIVREVINKIESTAFDRAHFSAYGDFSLDFEVVYYVMSSEYNKYMDIQQEINFAIKEQFENRGIEFAYPTRTIFLEKTEGPD